ncbi:MAG: hypothetical protein HQM16_09040 [Deltaproteobacteria bacterium]|nr:hypothetical protein [Deltaproteobacteria bacterium]
MHFDEETKTTKASSKRGFATTTRIKLSDTYDEDEITLVDNPQQSKKQQTRPSGVASHDPKPAIGQSLVSGDFQVDGAQVPSLHDEGTRSRPPRGIPSGHQSQVSNLSVVHSRFSELQNDAAKKQTAQQHKVRPRVMAAFGISLIILFTVLGGIYSKLSKKNGLSDGPVPPANSALKTTPITDLKLSPVVFYDHNNNEVKPNEIKVGSSYFLDYKVLNWNTSQAKKTQVTNLTSTRLGSSVMQGMHPRSVDFEIPGYKFTADLKIYTAGGRLILFKPEYLIFDDFASMNSEALKVRTRLDLSQDMPAGAYTVVLSLREIATQQQKDLEAKITVVK